MTWSRLTDLALLRHRHWPDRWGLWLVDSHSLVDFFYWSPRQRGHRATEPRFLNPPGQATPIQPSPEPKEPDRGLCIGHPEGPGNLLQPGPSALNPVPPSHF